MPDENSMAAAMEPASSESSEPQTPPAAESSSPAAETPGTPQPTAEPSASEPEAAEDVSEKRIRDLQSKWEGERVARLRAEQERDAARALTPPDEQPKAPWEPKDFNELDGGIRERARQVFLEEQQRVAEAQRSEQMKQEEARTQVQGFFTEVKSVDPTFDPTAFSKWVEGKPFRMETINDVRASYGIYREVRAAEQRGEQRALKNKADRSADPVAKPGIGAPGAPSLVSAEQFQRAGSAYEVAMQAMERAGNR